MLISNNFFFDEQRMSEFKVCSCIIDLTVFGVKKLDSIKKIVEFPKDKCDRHLFDIFYDNSYIVFCKICLGFAAKSDPCLYNDCSLVCPNEAADPNSVNCIDLFAYGFEDFCVGCLNILPCFLIKNLHTVKLKWNP